MTNYEKIMSEMTAEKLAVLLSENYRADGIAEWLKQEAEDEAD